MAGSTTGCGDRRAPRTRERRVRRVPCARPAVVEVHALTCRIPQGRRTAAKQTTQVIPALASASAGSAAARAPRRQAAGARAGRSAASGSRADSGSVAACE